MEKGRKHWTTGDTSRLPGVMEWGPNAEAFPLEFETWEVDIRGARTAGGGRKPKFRPIFDRWRCVFDLAIDVDEIKPGTFQDIIDASGRKIGIGAMRPERKLTYGTFRVVSFAAISKPLHGLKMKKASELLKELLAKSEVNKPKRKRVA
jgi:hypothetical protein